MGYDDHDNMATAKQTVYRITLIASQPTVFPLFHMKDLHALLAPSFGCASPEVVLQSLNQAINHRAAQQVTTLLKQPGQSAEDAGALLLGMTNQQIPAGGEITPIIMAELCKETLLNICNVNLQFRFDPCLNIN
eukprot:scaffold10862_cov33-Prasinocladus_malaysianus.AAC.1